MFKRYDVHLTSNPYCDKAIDNINNDDFLYYDKDGFELNIAEQKYYSAMKYPIHYPILNHCCWQEPWFELESKSQKLVLDHSMFLCRCGYTGQAYEQLKKIKELNPMASFLLQTRVKWGFDFALDAVKDGEIFEVLHIEFDSYDYEYFTNRFINFDYVVRHTDWYDAADRIWANRTQWQSLKGFAQNDWKANYLINWRKAEYTEKCL